MKDLQTQRSRPPTVEVLALAALCLAVRLPGLRSMPIFGDEAIRLHWGLLVRENPIHFALVSMQAPLPPLHSWLLALFRPLAEDPLRAGRLLSVFFGVLTVPAFYLLCAELRSRLIAAPLAGRAFPGPELWIGGLSLVLCPYLAFHQRVALAEALFVLEATIAAWLAVRLAFDPRVRTALSFGVAMAAAMLTRQNLSYVLWILPPLAFVVSEAEKRARGRRFGQALACSFGIGLLLWIPTVVASREVNLVERLVHSRLLTAPMGVSERLQMTIHNSGDILDWLWTYMTPPVLLAALGSIVGLLRKGEKRLVAFLAVWVAVILLPLAVFGRFLFSRYGVTAAIPLLAAIGLFFDRLVHRKTAAALVAIALLVWPIRDLLLQDRDWRKQVLVSLDRWQFVTGWPAGAATQQAADFLRHQAERGRFVLLIPRNEGNPMDTLWVDFSQSTSVRAFSVGDVLTEPLLRRGASPGTMLVDDDPWRRRPTRSVTITPETPVYHVSPEPIYTREGPVPASDLLTRLNSSLEEVARFWNPPEALSGRATDGVVVYRVR